MKKKYELYLLSFVLFFLILSLPLLKTKKIIVNLPTSNNSILNTIKNTQLITPNIESHQSKNFFRKDNNKNLKKVEKSQNVF